MSNIRYVITHIDKRNMRTLTFRAQGRDTYKTKEEAQNALDLFLKNSLENLVTVHGEQSRGTFAVRPCECYPDHHDPKGIFFDT